MHSVHMSSFRVLTKQRSRKSYKLGELNGDNKLSAYEITKRILQSKVNTPLEDQDSKLIVSIPTGNLTFDDSKRIIYGYVNAGRYGENYTVRQKTLSSANHKKVTHDEVTEKKRYIFIYLPDSLDTGIFAFHETSRLNARTPIKSTVELGFKAHNPSLEARILPLLHKDIPQTIKDSPVIEIKAIGYKTSKDTADAMRLIGDRMTADFVIKNKGYSMGYINDYLGKSPSQNKLIDILEPNSDKIKITAQVNGRNKIYDLRNIIAKGVSVTLDDASLNIDPITNEPNQTDLHNCVKEEINDYICEIYGKGYCI
ncbi:MULTISPECIES: hypothetical protein [Gammaproteobacteria]|uniref:hypothetical protein n=1 Tax=Gammaproteobacteria TaxID=1236 RepID=UPI000615924F|nr:MULTISPECIES: hypothetical protein [Gammaproteobacteria]AKB05076.1 hypothetical protein VAB027_3736 [Vibrio cholerae]PWF91369.1 hypothetical protein DD549_13565 [Shewanella algae]GHY98374.1 hypothetical protein VCSRO27_2456 [Vibrio cholerae]HDI3137091.1 hypothetical protein [Vibrio cholerae]